MNGPRAGGQGRSDEHTGRPLIRSTEHGRVLVLCSAGHLVQSVKVEDWAHSSLEARCADPDYMVSCRGTVAS